jgi:hypothetical protein
MSCGSKKCGKSCGCQKPGPRDVIETKVCKKDSCCEEEVDPCCKGQIDTRDVFYRLKADCNSFSNLDILGIPKGADLEHILERMGRYIATFNYFDVKDNMYGSKDFNEFMLDLQEDIQKFRLEILNFTEKLETQQLTLTNIQDRLIKLENPKILDSRGLGFTVNDNIFKVLQILASNG